MAVSIPARLREDLAIALRSQNRIEASMIRTLMAAIDNAEAIEASTTSDPKIGLDHDQPRRDLTTDDVTRIVEGERDELAEAVDHYRQLGLTDQVEELETRLRIVNRYLD